MGKKYPTDEQKTERLRWARQFFRCWVCLKGTNSGIVAVHEMARRSQSPNSWADPCNYFATGFDCDCNCHATQLATMPPARQLAYKLIFDFDNFNLGHWLRLRRKPASYVEWHEIAAELADLYRTNALPAMGWAPQ